MSKIASLIKQAFGTSNPHEAASFLASAINRMKGWEKSQISTEVEAALAGINFSRTADEPKATTPKTKTVYKDTAETLRSLAEYKRLTEVLQRELAGLRATHAEPKEIIRLKSRIEALTKAQEAIQRAHLEELAMARICAQGASGDLELQNENLTAAIGDLKRDAVQLRQQITERNGRIDRLKKALAASAEGSDMSAVECEELERRLTATLFDLAEAKRDLSNSHAELTKARDAIAVKDRALDLIARRDSDAADVIEELTAKNNALQLRMNQQETSHSDEIREEQIKRRAAGRRADDAERQTTQTKAKLKFEECNGERLTRERNELKTKLELAISDVSMHEDNARHNYYECESLTAKLHLAQKELEELRHKSTHLFGIFHKASAFIGMMAAGLCVAIGTWSDGITGATDSVQAAVVVAVISYGVTHYLVKDM